LVTDDLCFIEEVLLEGKVFMLEREGDLCQAFDSLKDEEDLYLEGVRVTVLGVELFMVPFDATRLLVEDN